MANEVQYFNFPIQLLEGFLIDHSKVLKDILDYSLYAHSLKLEYGNEDARMKASATFFHITLGSLRGTIQNGKLLYNSIDERSPKVGINLTIFWDYYKNEKTEFEKVCLLAFLGIKSILQKKPYCKMENKFWLARMDGKTHSCDFTGLSHFMLIYANEYQTKKIKEALRDWGLITYSRYTRGFYVSFSMSLQDLIYEAEKRRKSTKEKQYKAMEKEALAAALQKLNSKRP